MASEMVVAKQEQVAFTRAFEPGDFAGAMKMAEFLAKSSLVPGALRGKAHDIMVLAMQGRELGWPIMRSLNLINVIQGKAAITAQGLAGLVMESAACEFFTLVESTAEKAVYETKRRGATRSVVMAYTIEQAKAAGLTSKDNWRRMPAEMLRARCQAALARAVYPDVLAGLYTVDELRDTPQFAPPPAKQQAAVPPPVSEPDPEAEVVEAPHAPDRPETVVASTGEIVDAQVPYESMNADERVGYWNLEFFGAPNVDVLRVLGASLAKVEPAGSAVRSGAMPAYKERMAQLTGGAK